MTGWVVIGLLLALMVVAGVMWARARSARSDRRSMESYGHGLEVLGDVARRTGPPPRVRVVPRGEAGQAHVRTEVAQQEATGAPGDGRARAGAAAAPEAPVRPGRPATSVRPPEIQLSFGEGDEPPAGLARRGGREPVAARAPADRGTPPPSRIPVPPGGLRQAPKRRLSVFAVAGVSVLLVIAGAILLTGLHSKPSAGHRPVHKRRPPVTAPARRVTTTTTPVVRPVSISGHVFSFLAPSGNYTLAFSTQGGACWVGIETGVGSGNFLWSETVQPGTSGSYVASGPLAVVLGAPQYVSVTLNGVPVRFPSTPYVDDLVFQSG